MRVARITVEIFQHLDRYSVHSYGEDGDDFDNPDSIPDEEMKKRVVGLIEDGEMAVREGFYLVEILNPGLDPCPDERCIRRLGHEGHHHGSASTGFMDEADRWT